MRITKIYLEHIRNYALLSLAVPEGALVFEGDNGAGKTNLLEAIYFLALCRSFRSGRDRDVVLRGSDRALVRTDAVGADGTVAFALEYDLSPPEKRAFFNGNRVYKLTDYVGTFPAVAFHPDDLEIVKGPPVNRRRFLDHWLVQYDRGYIYLLKRYHDALTQRNALLRSSGGSPLARPEYGPVTGTLVDAGAALTAARRDKLDKLVAYAAEEYRALTGGGEELKLFYAPGAVGGEDPEAFRAALSARAADERRLRKTLVGPHLDDLGIRISGLDARRFASQGQQRTVALALRLAQFRVMAAGLSETPVLLLDDAFSELDRNRTRRLAEAVSAAEQAWITSTRPLDGVPGSRFAVANGTVTEL